MTDEVGASLIDAAPRAIGTGGMQTGPLAFGCWRFVHDSVADARAVIEAALANGMTLVDTADVYGLDWGGGGFGAAEELLGKVLADAPELRDRMVLATKGGIHPGVPYDSSRAHLEAAVDASLRRLGVDVIDLYQIHRPDLLTSPAAVADTLLDLRARGKVRELGVSNHTPAQYDALQARLVRDGGLATLQPELSALNVDAIRDGTLDLCMRDGVLPLAWSPLAGGRLLTGDGVPPALVSVLDELAEREDVDRAAVAFAFVLAHPARPVVIVGTQRPDRLRAATAALSVQLDRRDWYRILEASEGRPLP